MRFLSFFLSGGLLLVAAACGSSSNVQPQIPYAPVNLSFNITNQQYVALRSPNGVVALPVSSAVGNGGVKGVLVVRQADGSYLAFERNCPYRPYDACSIVGLDRQSRVFLRDSCCGSTFNFQGQVTGGPSTLSLVRYNVSLAGSQLSITN